jgi:hypothetical protein
VRNLNAIVDRAFDWLLAPLRPLPVSASLAVVAAVTAVALLFVIRATSNQQALAAVKRQIHADLLEIRLFNDDLAAMFRAERDFLRHNVTYLRLSLVPALWTVIPLIIAMPQLDAYFGYHGVAVAQPTLVTAQIVAPLDRQPGLDLPPGVHSDTPAVWFPALQQFVWRVAADAPGDYVLRLRVGANSYDKTLHVSDVLARRSPVRTTAGFLNELFHPSELPMPSSGLVESISVAYPEWYVDVWGWNMSWFALYFAEVILFAVMLKRPLGVTL